MKSINTNEIKPNTAFTEDSFIEGNLFFLPKNLPISDYHINLLKLWDLSTITTEGTLSLKTIKNQPIDSPEKPQDGEAKKILQQKQSGAPENSKEEDGAKTKLLDNSIKNFVDVYKDWIKETVRIFKEIIIEKNVDKEKVKNLVDDIIKTANSNRNNALMLFGKKI